MSGLPLKTEADWRRMIANYWGLNSLVDTHVGMILRTAEECGLMDNTIIVFTSDHGDMMGSHRLLAKCVMFEEAVRIPLMIRLPGQRTQRRIAKCVSQIDLVPTLLDLLGAAIPDHLQGKSRRREIEGGENGAAEDVFIEWNGTESGILEAFEKGPYPDSLAAIATREEMSKAVADPIRTVITPDGWKLNWSQLGQHELYDLKADPIEINNLAGHPKHVPEGERVSEENQPLARGDAGLVPRLRMRNTQLEGSSSAIEIDRSFCMEWLAAIPMMADMTPWRERAM